MRKDDQARAIAEVKQRVLALVTEKAGAGGPALEDILAETIYQERARLKEDRSSKSAGADRALYDEVERTFLRSSERTQRDLLTRVVDHYVREIAGNFDPRVYQMVTRAIPPTLGLLLNAASPKHILGSLPNLPMLDDAVVLQGEIEHLRRLHELGTVLMVPTHVSNLDSIVLGFALYRLGLPPFVYGAGLNLFQNPMIGFFMHNLGAYTVDRKKRDPLYKEVLKTYATLTLELGYDGLFFPGGTRARSGAVERRLKLGLLGTAVAAYTQNLLRKAHRPKVFVVPATLSYQLVLEAETLIDDFLKEVGKAQYIITDDEFAKPRRVFDFVSSLFNLDSKIYFTVGRGFDPFGNPVDDQGESLDPCQRQIDPARYLYVRGEPRPSPARDAEYTKEMGERVVESYFKNNLLQATHVTARVVFGLLRQKNPKTRLLRLLRAGGPVTDFSLAEIYEATDHLLRELRPKEKAGALRLDPSVLRGDPEEVISDGLKHFAIYHQQPAVTRQGDRLRASDRNLLFYYQNRLEGCGLWPEPALVPALNSDHRSLGAGA